MVSWCRSVALAGTSYYSQGLPPSPPSKLSSSLSTLNLYISITSRQCHRRSFFLLRFCPRTVRHSFRTSITLLRLFAFFNSLHLPLNILTNRLFSTIEVLSHHLAHLAIFPLVIAPGYFVIDLACAIELEFARVILRVLTTFIQSIRAYSASIFSAFTQHHIIDLHHSELHKRLALGHAQHNPANALSQQPRHHVRVDALAAYLGLNKQLDIASTT